MKQLLRHLVIVPMLLGLLAAPLWAADSLAPAPISQQAEMLHTSPPGELVLVDIFVLRPLGFAASLIGLGSSVVAYPFGAMSDSTDVVSQKLIQEPWDYTFKRPVGRIDY